MNQRKEFLKNFVKEEFDNLIKNLNDSFISWENFCKTTVIFSYLKKTNTELFSNLKNKSNSIEELKYPILTEEETLFLTSYSFEFLKEQNIKLKYFQEYSDNIEMFYKKSGIDFKNLTTEDKFKTLQNEDISGETAIFEHLNLTHMQFKYLYQTGSVLVL